MGIVFLPVWIYQTLQPDMRGKRWLVAVVCLFCGHFLFVLFFQRTLMMLMNYIIFCWFCPPPLHYPCLIFLFVCFVNCVGSLLFSFPLPSTPLSLSLYKQFAVTKLGRWQPGTCTPYQLFFFTSYTKIFTPLKTLIMYPPISSNRIMCMLIISSILYTHNTWSLLVFVWNKRKRCLYDYYSHSSQLFSYFPFFRLFLSSFSSSQFYLLLFDLIFLSILGCLYFPFGNKKESTVYSFYFVLNTTFPSIHRSVA